MTPQVQPINLTTGLAAAIARGETLELRRLPNRRIDAIRPGRPGTLLWVREPFRMTIDHDGSSPTQAVAATGDTTVRYEADRHRASIGTTTQRDDAVVTFGRLRFAREMPRVLSRATLIVRSVRREPLQDIGDHPVRAEGFRSRKDFARAWNVAIAQWHGSASRLRWQDNPEVVVIHVQPQRANIDDLLAAARPGKKAA